MHHNICIGGTFCQTFDKHNIPVPACIKWKVLTNNSLKRAASDGQHRIGSIKLLCVHDCPLHVLTGLHFDCIWKEKLSRPAASRLGQSQDSQAREFLLLSPTAAALLVPCWAKPKHSHSTVTGRRTVKLSSYKEVKMFVKQMFWNLGYYMHHNISTHHWQQHTVKAKTSTLRHALVLLNSHKCLD